MTTAIRRMKREVHRNARPYSRAFAAVQTGNRQIRARRLRQEVASIQRSGLHEFSTSVRRSDQVPVGRWLDAKAIRTPRFRALKKDDRGTRERRTKMGRGTARRERERERRNGEEHI